MPRHSTGKAISRLRDRNIWRLDPKFWSANRAEHHFADGHELVAFDLLAACGHTKRPLDVADGQPHDDLWWTVGTLPAKRAAGS